MRIKDALDLDEEEQLSEFSKALPLTYSWFDYNFSLKVAQSSTDYWDCSMGCRLVALSENVNILAPSDQYFVTQIRLNKELSVFIRLSKQIVKALLEGTLGLSKKSFNIEKLTELEAKILTEYNNFVYASFQEMVLKGNELPKNNTNYNECNLTYFLQDKEDSLGKIIITIPIIAIKPEKMTLREDVFTIENFTSYMADVNIEIGKTKIKLNELKQLEVDDVVLLDESNSSEMTLLHDGNRTTFRVAPNPSLMIDFDVHEDNGGKSVNDLYNMWDTIQVEMGAEFEKVKLSLGELKQISEGLVVDVGSVYENKIDLKVEDKIIASGELVIINDRYGVRINEIFTEEKNNASEHAQIAQEEQGYAASAIEEEPAVVQQPQPQSAADEFSEEDFDYSDFDVDEEDI